MIAATEPSDVVSVLEPLVLQRSSELPVLPAAATQALELVRRPDGRVDALIAVLERDPTLAARVLGVASSGFYARGAPPTSLRQALVRLGWNAVRDVLTMAVYSSAAFDVPGLTSVVRDTFDHCAQTARAARALAPRFDLDPELAFLAGLLHDVGHARCLKIARGALPRETSREHLFEACAVLHERAGAVLARHWRLPEEVALACGHHHAPARRDHAALIALVDAVFDRESSSSATQLAMALSALELDPTRMPEIEAEVAAAR